MKSLIKNYISLTFLYSFNWILLMTAFEAAIWNRGPLPRVLSFVLLAPLAYALFYFSRFLVKLKFGKIPVGTITVFFALLNLVVMMASEVLWSQHKEPPVLNYAKFEILPKQIQLLDVFDQLVVTLPEIDRAHDFVIYGEPRSTLSKIFLELNINDEYSQMEIGQLELDTWLKEATDWGQILKYYTQKYPDMNLVIQKHLSDENHAVAQLHEVKETADGFEGNYYSFLPIYESVQNNLIRHPFIAYDVFKLGRDLKFYGFSDSGLILRFVNSYKTLSKTIQVILK